MAETRQLNIRVALPLYQALETFAQQERRSVSQAVRQLMEDGLRQRLEYPVTADDTPGQDIALWHKQVGPSIGWHRSPTSMMIPPENPSSGGAPRSRKPSDQPW